MKRRDQFRGGSPEGTPEQGRVMLRLAIGDKRMHLHDRTTAIELVPKCCPPGEGLARALLQVAEDTSERAPLRQTALASLEQVFLLGRLVDGDDEADAPLRWPSAAEMSEALRRLHDGAQQPALVRRAALAAGCALPGQWQDAAVRTALAKDDEEWRTAALHCLKHLSDVETEILEALGDDDPTNLRLALEAAGTHRVTGAWPVTLSVLRAPKADPDLRASALLTAAHLRPEAAEEWIAPFLASEDDILRSAAALAMSVAQVDAQVDARAATSVPSRVEPVRETPPPPEEDGTPQQRAASCLAAGLEEDTPEGREEWAWRALDAWPDCANAWLVLASDACIHLPVRAAALEEAVRAGERALGPEFFRRHEGRFGARQEAAAYLRARFELATALRELGRGREAARHCRGLLKLDPDDRMDARPLLLDLLLEAGDDRAARELLADAEETEDAAVSYASVLLALRADREDPRCRRLLERAVARNPHVPAFLTGRPRSGPRPPRHARAGSRWEAESVARSQGPAWRATRGALSWLRKHARPPGRRG